MKQLLKGVLLLCAAAALTACGAKSEAASSVVTVLPESASSSAVTAPAPEHPLQLPESSTAGASDLHAGMDADLDLTQLAVQSYTPRCIICFLPRRATPIKLFV